MFIDQIDCKNIREEWMNVYDKEMNKITEMQKMCSKC